MPRNVLLVLVLLAGGLAPAQLPDGPDFMLDTIAVMSPSYDDEQLPSAAFNGQNLFVGWYSWFGVSGARIRPDGTVLDSTGIKLTAPDAENFTMPSVTFDGTNWFATWSEYDGSLYSIRGARVAPDGAVLDPGGFVISSSTIWQRMSAAAFDGENYLVAWQDRRNGTTDDIYAARVTPQGTVLDPGGFAVCTASNVQELVKVSRSGEQCLVAWQDKRSGSSFDIYAARVNRAGTVLDPDGIPVSTGIRHKAGVAVSGDGTNWLLAWEDSRTMQDKEVYAARVSAAGAVLDPDGIAVGTAERDQLQAGVCHDGTNWLVGWIDGRNGFWGQEVYATRVAPDGTVLDPDGIPVTAGDAERGYAAVARSATGWMVFWGDLRSEMSNDIYAARISTQGSVLDTAGILVSWGANTQEYPDCASDGSGYLAVWQEYRGGGIDLYGAVLSETGGTLHAFVVAESLTRRPEPKVAYAGPNHLVAWLDMRGSDDHIYAARVTPDGTLLDPDGFAVYTGEEDAEEMYLTSDGTNWLVVWNDERAGWDDDVYAARIAPDGTVLDPDGRRITFDPENTMENPAAAFNGTNYLIAWRDGRSGGAYETYGARLAPDGTLLDSLGFRITPESIGTDDADVASDGNGWLVVWEDSRGDTCRVFAARVAADGTVLDPDGILLWDSGDDQSSPVVAYDGTHYVVVWRERRGEPTGADLYGAKVNSAGQVVDTFAVSLSPGNQLYHALATGAPGSYLLVWEQWTTDYRGRSYNTDRVWGRFGLVPGVEEQRLVSPVNPRSAGPTIVRGVLRLGAGHDRNPPGDFGSCPKPVLLDAAGRKVMDLQPGENDVRHLAPGVYFVRPASGAAHGAASITRVVVVR